MEKNLETKRRPKSSTRRVNPPVGRAVLRRRQDLGLSQIGLAKITDISRRLLGRYEKDESTPGFTNAKLLCDALGITHEQLHGYAPISDVPAPPGVPVRGTPSGAPASETGCIASSTVAQLGLRDVRFTVTWLEEGDPAALVPYEDGRLHLLRERASRPSDIYGLRALIGLFAERVAALPSHDEGG